MNENFQERLAELPPNLANHLMLTVVALGVGIAVSLPLAIFLAKQRRLQYPFVTAAGVIQTIPSLALVALMVPLLAETNGLGLGLAAFGFWPAVIALTLYSILPVLRNTVTGFMGVDAALIEAARGVGMNEWQVLWKVQLPLAAPVIIAGVRTATVWVVGIATLATPVGQRCLGNYIFTGLQTRNWVMVMFGVVSAAGLAIVLDLLIAGVQRAAQERRRMMGTLSAAALLGIVVLGLISPSIVQAARRRAHQAVAGALAAPQAGVIRVGAKTFTEQYILASVVQSLLRDAGFETRRTESLGSTVIFDALRNGDLDVYVDYSGTIWANYMKRRETVSRPEVLAQITAWLQQRGIRCLGSLGFENAYALAMRRARAQSLGIKSIADLAARAAEMDIGGDYEFFGRPEWRHIRKAYGLHFQRQVSYASTLMYEAVAADDVQVIAAFSSDGRIAAYGLTLLADPKQAIPPYDAVLLLGPRVAGDERVAAALRFLIESIDVRQMQQANLMVDREQDKKTPAQAAEWLISQSTIRPEEGR